MPMAAKSGLAKKLSEVYAEVERIPKKGHNTHHNYDFVREADASDAIRGILHKKGVMLFVSCPDYAEVETTTQGGGKNYLTTAHLVLTFVDSETGEEREVSWYGRGMDTQDKGLAKAQTSGLKYFLLKTFLIPTGEDPDEDGPSNGSGARRRSTTTKPKDEPAEEPSGATAGSVEETASEDDRVDYRVPYSVKASDPATAEQWDAAKQKFGNTGKLMKVFMRATQTTSAKRNDVGAGDMDDLLGPKTPKEID